MSEPHRILVLDDDADVGTAARILLRRRFGEVDVLQQPAALLAQIERNRPDVLLLDMNFAPGQADGEQGLRLLRQVLARRDAPAVIMMTAYAEVELAVQALKLGAFDFITKPWDNAKLIATISAALASRAPQPAGAAGASSALLGDSAPMQELRALIASVAPTEANVLILGEMGAGKELVAQALHQGSARAGRDFLAVDMGALPESTFESELFGHRRGSFTDAKSERPGRFQAARGGTLFLDEIGNLSLANQAKLLTALERRQVTPLGADRPEAIDVRVVSATNLAEAQLFDAASFRPDLLYRLNTIVLARAAAAPAPRRYRAAAEPLPRPVRAPVRQAAAPAQRGCAAAADPALRLARQCAGTAAGLRTGADPGPWRPAGAGRFRPGHEQHAHGRGTGAASPLAP